MFKSLNGGNCVLCFRVSVSRSVGGAGESLPDARHAVEVFYRANLNRLRPLSTSLHGRYLRTQFGCNGYSLIQKSDPVL